MILLFMVFFSMTLSMTFLLFIVFSMTFSMIFLFISFGFCFCSRFFVFFFVAVSVFSWMTSAGPLRKNDLQVVNRSL